MLCVNPTADSYMWGTKVILVTTNFLPCSLLSSLPSTLHFSLPPFFHPSFLHFFLLSFSLFPSPSLFLFAFFKSQSPLHIGSPHPSPTLLIILSLSLLYFSSVLEIEPRPFHKFGKCPTTKLHLYPTFSFVSIILYHLNFLFMVCSLTEAKKKLV